LIIGLDRAPSRETVREAASRLPESYLKRLNDRLVKPLKRGAWFTIRKDRGERRTYIIALASLAIINL